MVTQWTKAGGCVIDNLWRAFQIVIKRKVGAKLDRDKLEPGLCQIRCVANPLVEMVIAVVMAEWYSAKDSATGSKPCCRALVDGARHEAIVAVTRCLSWLGELEEEALTHSESLAALGDAKIWETMIARSCNGVSAEAASLAGGLPQSKIKFDLNIIQKTFPQERLF